MVCFGGGGGGGGLFSLYINEMSINMHCVKYSDDMALLGGLKDETSLSDYFIKQSS